MSSSAQQVREKRTKTRGDFYCTRPTEAPSNSPVPHYGWLAQHALIMSYAIVLKAMWSLKPRQLPPAQGRDVGAVLNNASITRIAKATARFTNPLSDAPGEPMPRRTVGHCLTALQRKGFIEPWERHAVTSPLGTSWRIRRYDEVLQRWADDQQIGTIGKRAFYVIGKGRRHLTPAEIEAWRLNHAVAEANPKAQATAAIADEPAPAARTTPAPQPKTDAELDELKVALIHVCGAADSKDARYIWGTVAEACGTRQTPPVMDVAAMVYAIQERQHKTGNKSPINVELVRMRISGRVEAWHLYAQMDAQAATGTRGRGGYSPGDPRA